jgi:hypothetical protein
MMYSGSLISGAFSGLITAGITNGLTEARGLRAWRWMFIIEGAITVVIAVACFFVLPNFPRTTTWLTEQERQLAIWRLQEDVGEDDWVSSSDQGFWHGFKLAFTDIKTYVLMFLLLGLVSAGSVTNFFPSVVGTLGYNTINTLLLTVPPYVLAVITSMLNAWHADKTGERYWHITLPMYVAIVAFILAAATTSTAPRYVAMMLMVPGVYTGYVVALAWVSNRSVNLIRWLPKTNILLSLVSHVHQTSVPLLLLQSMHSATLRKSTRASCTLVNQDTVSPFIRYAE